MEHTGSIQTISEFYDIESVEKRQAGLNFYTVRDKVTGNRLQLLPIEFSNSWIPRLASEKASINYCSSLKNSGLAKYQGWFKEQSSQTIYAKVIKPSHPTISTLLVHNHTFLEDNIWDIAMKLVELLDYLHRNYLLAWSGLSPSFVHLTDQNEPILDDYFGSFRFKAYLSEDVEPFLAPEITTILAFSPKMELNSSCLLRDFRISSDNEHRISTSDKSSPRKYKVGNLTINIDDNTNNSVTTYNMLSTPRNNDTKFSIEHAIGSFKASSTPHLVPPEASGAASCKCHESQVTSISPSSLYHDDMSEEIAEVQHVVELAGLSQSKQFKADVWSLGALLLCLCLGKQISNNDDCVQLSQELCKDSKAGSYLYSYSLCSFIRNCLQPDPMKRPNISILRERIQIHMKPRQSLPESLRGSFCCHLGESGGSSSQLILTTPRGYSSNVDKFQQKQQMKSEDTDSPLIKAAEIGNYDAVKQNLGHIGKQGSEGRTALMFAAGNGHTKCIKLLVKEARMKDQQGLTALMYAVINKYKDTTLVLIKDEAGMQDNQGFTALMHATMSNSIDMVSILIKKAAGKELKKQNIRGETALMLATQYWNSEIADHLIKEARMANIDGSTALMYAAKSGNVNYVKLLVSKEAGMKALNGDRALELAIINSHADCADILSRYELKLTAGETPLLHALKYGDKRLATISTPMYSQNKDFSEAAHLAYAIQSNNAQAVKELLSFELPSTHTSDGSYLDLAIRSGHATILSIVYSYALMHSLGIYVSARPGNTVTKLMECAINDNVTGISSYLFQLGLTDEHGNSALMYAVRHNNYEVAVALICEATIQNLSGWTPLMVAAANCNVDLVHELAEHSHGFVTKRKESALMMAVKGASILCVRLLAKAEARKQDTNGTTALMLAVMLKQHAIAEILTPFEAGIQDVNGTTALMIAAQIGDLDMVRLLVNHEATLQTNSSCLDGAGWTAMMYAAREGYTEIISILVEHESNMQMSTGRTALMISAYSHNDSCVELLQASEREAQDEYGFTALMYAINSKYDNSDHDARLQIRRCIQLLLHEAHLSDYGEMTPISLAASINNIDVIKLIESNIILRKQLLKVDSQGMTALMHAATNGNTECVKELLKYDKTMVENETIHLSRKQDASGMTALMYASCNNRLSCVNLLLPLECNMVSNEKNTALMFAAREGYSNIVKELIIKSNELDIKNSDGSTALTFAAVGGYTECFNLLYDSYLNNEICPTNDGFTKLMLAASRNNIDAVRQGINEGEARKISSTGFTALMYAAINNSVESLLLLAPYEIKMTTESGITALMLAAKMGNVKCVEALIGEEIGMQSVQGWSALMFAAFSNKPRCVELLLKPEFELKNEDGDTALNIAKIYRAKEANEIIHIYHASLRLL